MDIRGIPVGFGYALIKDPDALRNFSILPEEQRKNVIEQVRLHSSKSEINSLIEKLACGKGF